MVKWGYEPRRWMLRVQKNISLSLILFMMVFCGLSGLWLSRSRVSASAGAAVRVSLACTMTATENSPHAATVSPNTYEEEIGKTTFTVTCNDNSGFSIYAVGYSGDEYGGTKLIANINGTISPSNDIITGTGTSGATSNWAMKIGAVSDPAPTYPMIIAGSTSDIEKESGDPDYSSYVAIPSTYTRVAYRNSVTDTVTGSSVHATYRAFISGTQPAGTYVGKVKYALIHPASEAPLSPQTTQSGKICYYPNGANVVGTMGCQTIPASGTTDGVSPTSATLLASNFSREGYGFAGWSDVYDYATNQNAHFYGPQEDITFTAGEYTGTNNGLSLYAVWVKSVGNLQDSSKVAELCGAGQGALTAAPTDGTANLTSVSALTDQRDGQTYAIAKLADGKCWMIENLRLEANDTKGQNRFDNSITNQSLAQGYGTSTTYGNFSGLADAESANFSNSTTANSLYYSGTQSGTATVNIGTSNYPGYRMPRYNNLNTQSRASTPTSNTFTDDNTTGGMYSYGNYYTWHAAIADTTHYSSGDHGTTSLCPTGWRLPIGDQSTAANSFGALSVALDGPAGGATANSSSTPTGTVMSKTFRSYPNNFLYSGIFDTSSALNRGTYGVYWSSTASNSFGSYYLDLNSSNVRPGTGGSLKYYGVSIRCTVSAGT